VPQDTAPASPAGHFVCNMCTELCAQQYRHSAHADTCVDCHTISTAASQPRFTCPKCGRWLPMAAQSPVTAGICRACNPPQQPLGLVDEDPKKVAHIQGWQEDGYNPKMHFHIEFWCPMCFDGTGTDDEMLVVNFEHDYAVGVGPENSRSAVCHLCKHAFVVSTSDILYAKQKVRNLKRLNYVRQKLYPCDYTHTPKFCEVLCSANPSA